MGKNLEERGRGIIFTYYPAILLEGLMKRRKPSAKIAGLRVEI
jgi:hypothetical protein